MVQNLQEVESMGTEKMDTKQEQRNKENEEIREMGTMELGKKGNPYGIQLLTIIGEIEGISTPEKSAQGNNSYG